MKSVKIYFLVVLLLLTVSVHGLSSVDQVNNSDVVERDVVIGQDHELMWNSYTVSYDKIQGTGSRILTFYDRQDVLMDQYSGTELFETLGEIQKVSEDLYVRPDELDREDGVLESTVWAPEDSFGSSEFNITAPQYIVVESGEELDIPIQVENTGGIEEAYELSAETDSLVSTSFRYEGYNVTKLVVEPGEEKEVQAKISLQDDIGRGLHTVNFSIFDRSFSSKNFSFQVTNSTEDERTLRMNLEESYTELNSGENFQMGVRVQNFGDSGVEDVEPSVSVPENWNYTLEPEDVENITGEEFQDFDLSIGVPSTATSGDYFVDVGLENTEDFDVQKLRVDVSDTSSGFGFLGLMLALFAVLLVAVVYKVFGRR